MKKMRFLLPVLVSAILCSLLVSCSKDYTGKEKTHPVFVKAGSAQNSGDSISGKGIEIGNRVCRNFHFSAGCV